MQITLMTRPDIIQTALDIAEKTTPFQGRNLQAPTGDLLGRLEAVWEDVRAGLQKAINRTAQEAREIARAVRETVEAKIAQAGAKAEELRQLLLDRLSKYVQGILDTMLRTLRSSLAVDGQQLKLTELEVTQTVTLNNSLQLSLEKAFEISAGGEVTVAASYSIAGA